MATDDIVVGVIGAVAKSDGLNPSEVDFVLAEYMDPEVLETLGDMEDGVWELTFRVSDHQVRITHDGAIFVNGVKQGADTARQK
ncbi:HalOD1 output domain-containing protein [Natrarchaeobaculum aegyptiacum]|uniref:Halobacterial output domain-containing protein n=1 Tax=Natrarchaeobaculum aegyptiacum TaxID=745377 RepID=A0A2Z2HZJ3_9EURY|nr:HalOD1 output domain-containing protein [Natrarchaeobaculum aegyptiacum]ARS91417.1 hypothetical protein B1756_17955 [Natrarchaeobaculum aegyptiacum]